MTAAEAFMHLMLVSLRSSINVREVAKS
jgi:hypothetical protein